MQKSRFLFYCRRKSRIIQRKDSFNVSFFERNISLKWYDRVKQSISIQLKLIRVFKVNKILYHNNSSSIFLSLLLCSFVLRRWIVGAHFSFDMKSGFLLLCVISFFQLQTCLGYYTYQLLLVQAFALSLSFISYSCKRKKNAWLVLKAVNV